MGIPDYIISHTIGEELKYRRAHDRLRDDMPAPQSRKNDTCDQVTSVRCQLSAFFRDLAGRIAPPPAVRGR